MENLRKELKKTRKRSNKNASVITCSISISTIMWWIWITKLILFLFTIYLGHTLWNYMKNIISKPKTKDLVNIQTDKYRNIIQELSENLSIKTQNEMTHNEMTHNETAKNEANHSPLLKQNNTHSNEEKETNDVKLSLENQLELQMDLEYFMSQII